MRVRLKADGRLVEILADGSERAMPPVPPEADARILAPSVAPDRPPQVDAGYARRMRSQTRLTQAEFAARIGVPIETVRNWEQGKRHPRGPARALLKLLDQAPDVAFSVLGRKSAVTRLNKATTSRWQSPAMRHCRGLVTQREFVTCQPSQAPVVREPTAPAFR